MSGDSANRMGGNRRTGKRRTKIPGVEKAGLENAGTSFVWVAKHNIINVHVVHGHVRVVLKRMYSNIVSRHSSNRMVRSSHSAQRQCVTGARVQAATLRKINTMESQFQPTQVIADFEKAPAAAQRVRRSVDSVWVLVPLRPGAHQTPAQTGTHRRLPE